MVPVIDKYRSYMNTFFNPSFRFSLYFSSCFEPRLEMRLFSHWRVFQAGPSLLFPSSSNMECLVAYIVISLMPDYRIPVSHIISWDHCVNWAFSVLKQDTYTQVNHSTKGEGE